MAGASLRAYKAYENGDSLKDGIQELINLLNGTVATTNLNTGGFTKSATVAVTRPNDTIQYAINDTLSADAIAATNIILSFAKANDKTGYLTNITVASTNNAATKADFDIFFFKTSLAAGADNTAVAITDVQMEDCLGFASFSAADAKVTNAGAGTTGNCIYRGTVMEPIALEPKSGETNVYCVIVMRSAYTPIASEKWTIRAGISQDA